MNVFTEDFMAPLFEALEACRNVAQSPVHHPEGDVFVHSLQTLKWAFRESDDTDLILAAMLHDVGKSVDSRGHEEVAVEWLSPHLSAKSLWLVGQHMRIWPFMTGEMRKLSKVRDLAGHPWLPELILLSRWDKLARNPRARVAYDKGKIIEGLNRCAGRRFGKPDMRITIPGKCGDCHFDSGTCTLYGFDNTGGDRPKPGYCEAVAVTVHTGVTG